MTENIKLIPAYTFDAKGYFNGETMWQVAGGETIEAPESTMLCPWGDVVADPSVFYRFVDGAWTTEAKPTKAEDLLGVVVSHSSMTQHDIEMRQLVQRFSETKGFHQVRGEDLSWSIEKDPEPTPEEKRKAAEDRVRAERDSRLNATVWLVERHKSQKELGHATSITNEQYLELLQYQQDLRDVPQQTGFPDSVVWPETPAFVM